uniref:Uncharacterized protein n=1 Tax=Anguilla anguilla TaxID=7936 RepID=A0A0E9SC22_ANGAN
MAIFNTNVGYKKQNKIRTYIQLTIIKHLHAQVQIPHLPVSS